MIRTIADGTITLGAYLLYLRNLYAVYASLERRLRESARSAELGPLTAPAIIRAPALISDLEALAGPEWLTELQEFPTCRRYVADIETATLSGLIAHAYVRYLGDLNGGAVLRRFLKRALALPDPHLAFYSFPEIENREDFAKQIRVSIDVATPISDYNDVLTTGAKAFELNIALADEVWPGSTNSGALDQKPADPLTEL